VNKTRIAAAAFAVAASVGVAVAVDSAAQAATTHTKWSECRGGGDILTGWTNFTYGSQNTIYVSSAGFNIERNGAKHNNVYLKLRGKGGATTYYTWISKDNIVGGRSYTIKGINKRIPRGSKPYMKYHATFDQNGPDPSCSAYGHLGW
jgi:hypothetical protein